MVCPRPQKYWWQKRENYLNFLNSNPSLSSPSPTHPLSWAAPTHPQIPALVSLLQDHWTCFFLSIVGLGRRKLRWCLQLKIILIKWHILGRHILIIYTPIYCLKDNTCTWLLKILHKTTYSENVLSYPLHLPDVFPEFIYASTSIIHTIYHSLFTCDSILTTWCCTLPSFLLIHTFNIYQALTMGQGLFPVIRKKQGAKQNTCR